MKGIGIVFGLFVAAAILVAAYGISTLDIPNGVKIAAWAIAGFYALVYFLIMALTGFLLDHDNDVRSNRYDPPRRRDGRWG